MQRRLRIEGFGIPPSKIVGYGDGTQKESHHRIERAEPDGLSSMPDRLLIPPGKGQAVAEVACAAAEFGLRSTARRNAAMASSVRRSMRA